MLELLPKPAVIAHRGASAHAPENTLSSFHLALSHQAHAIEFDVQLTRDHQVIVFHDRTLDRTTNGNGPVSKQSWSEIQSLNAGAAYGSAFRGERIPSLAQVLDQFSDSFLYNIELKEYSSPWGILPIKVINLVQEKGLEAAVLLSSFNPFTILETHKLSTSIQKGYIIHGLPLLIWFQLGIAALLPVDSVHLSANFLKPSILRTLRSIDKKVFFYTLNHPGEIKKALSLKIDGFFTDDPALARRTITEMN